MTEAIVFGITGAVLGAVIGSRLKSEGWSPMSMSELGTLTQLSTTGGPQLILVKRF